MRAQGLLGWAGNEFIGVLAPSDGFEYAGTADEGYEPGDWFGKKLPRDCVLPEDGDVR